jgi:hypothetical protein
MKYKPNEFALLSLGRCGTTMFQNMINCHSELYLSDECHWMRGMLEPGLQYHRFAEVDDLTVNKIPDNSKWWDALKALNSSLLLDKQDKKCGLQYIGKTNLKNIAPLYKTYPQLPSIILIRDPRSLLHSLYRTGIGYPSAANDLRNTIETVKHYTDNVLIVKYEDFILEPENCIKSVCTFLKVKFETEMLNSLANVVSHGTQSTLALSESNTHKKKLTKELPLSLLFPICNLVEDVKTLGYETFQKNIKIITNVAPTPHFIFSKHLVINFDSTISKDGEFITEANANCLGLISIESKLTKIELHLDSQVFTPTLSFFELHVFDIRKAETPKVKQLKHKNFKEIVALLDIFESIKQKRIYIYSAGTETEEFIERYEIINRLNIVAIIDISPKRKLFSHKNFLKKIIALPQIEDKGSEIFLITTLKHCKSAKNNLMELGVDADRIFTVI